MLAPGSVTMNIVFLEHRHAFASDKSRKHGNGQGRNNGSHFAGPI
jgi:hypothetical protein